MSSEIGTGIDPAMVHLEDGQLERTWLRFHHEPGPSLGPSESFIPVIDQPDPTR
jgi:hypothetical protein